MSSMDDIHGCGGWCIESGLASSFGVNNSEDVGPGGMGAERGSPVWHSDEAGAVGHSQG
jgi:hypothetical protein